MSRKIELTKIHAINWYGYRDSFDINGNLLVAGVTGSGKSVLMDLIQFVLVADQRKIHYNRSATGERSTRDLIGYCLGDIKQDVAGARQFMRDKGITFVALEFAWPGRKRVETWGIRIEFESTLRREPSRSSPFFLPLSLKRNDFLDDGRKPLEFLSFKQMAERLGGRIFTGAEEYRREMSLPSHLNFDRFTLDYLLPAAMSFTFMDSFDDFCGEYILPSEDVDIQSVKDSYLAFLSLQRELSLLRDQLDRLERIQLLERQRTAARAQARFALYLESETRCQHGSEQLALKKSELGQLEDELSEETSLLHDLEQDIEKARDELDQIKSSFNATDKGQLYFRITAENRQLISRIEQLKEVASSVEDAKQARARNVETWINNIEASSLQVKANLLTALKFAANQLAVSEPDQIREFVRVLGATVSNALSALELAARPTVEKAGQLRQEIERYRRMLEAVRGGIPTENTVLLVELNKYLARRGPEHPAQALWQLCEVSDERWRPAIETVFTRKFAIVVDARDYDQAERIYHELRLESRGESLINPLQIPEAIRKPGSLAEKLETNHPAARAIVDHLFGDVICVEVLKDLRNHSRAILPDGFMAQRPFVQRPRHYDNRPCIGKRGLEKQRAWLEAQINELHAQLLQIGPLLQEYDDLKGFALSHKLESDNLHDELDHSRQLPGLKRQLEENLRTLTRIHTSDLEQKQRELSIATDRLRELEHRQTGVLRNSRRALLETLQRAVDDCKNECERLLNRFQEIDKAQDFSTCFQEIAELRQTVIIVYQDKIAAADRFLTLHHEANAEARTKTAELVADRKALAAHPDYGTHYADFNHDADSNEEYDKRLVKIREAEIREYEQKANREEINWQQLFRTQVLEKLQQKLGEAENLIALLKTELKDPIGSNRYTITSVPNRDGEYQVYRRLIDAASYARDGELFFVTADAEVRETVEKLFAQLIKQPESKEALAFLDYRNYNDYDMLVEDVREPDQPPSSLNKHSGMFSGGENQAPFFIAILACYLRAYRRYERRRRDPALALVPIDEAFSKLSGDCIHDCIAALRQLDLQGVFSMSTGNIPYAIDDCDQVIAVHKQVSLTGKKKNIRNVAAMLTRQAAYERFTGIRKA